MKTFAFSIAILCITFQFTTGRNSSSAAETVRDSTEKRISLSLHAGPHERLDILLSAMVDAGNAQSVWIEFADGSLSRAQLVEPGILDAHERGKGKKELHFVVPKMAKGETMKVVAALSERPIEGRGYVWTGEPNQSRRLSCSQCHQGISLPTAAELRDERQVLEKTGKVLPLALPRLLPTANGKDFRWHEKPGRYETSACWECHGRHMIQYEFGRTLRSVYHSVFRTDGDRTFAETVSAADAASGRAYPCGIHYAFQRVTTPIVCSDVVQQHAGILAEEAGKFIGRHCVLIHWIGNPNDSGQRNLIAKEERQLTVKNTRARNGSRANWFDFASQLKSVAGTVSLDGAVSPAGFRFVPPIDSGTKPEYQEAAQWRAITFVFEGTTYTAACFDHPGNPKLVPENPSRPLASRNADPSIGYSFSAKSDEQNPLVVHYRLWIQEGRMPAEEIQSMSNDFLEPVKIAAQ